MYLFEAHYINVETEKEKIKRIEFEAQFFDTEKECYLYAIENAYDLVEENEMLCSLEFIAC